MAISRKTKNSLDKQDFDTIDSEWLARMEEDPLDLDYFIGVARALVGTSQEDRASTLLEMLDDQYHKNEHWAFRLLLLEEAGKMYLSVEDTHPAILTTLEKIHGEVTAYEGLLSVVGLDKAVTDIPKTWEKVRRFEDLVSFDVGSIVYMEGKGPGKVAEVNLALSSFRIDFTGLPRLSVGFRAAAKLLTVLPPGHIMRLKIEDPEGLKKLAKDDPPQFLRAILESHGKPMAAGDVKKAVAGIVTPKKWTSWWAAARKHPQVMASSGGRQTYTWAATSEDAIEGTWQTFERADSRKKLDLLRREGSRDEELGQRMAERLEEIAVISAVEDPALAAEIGLALERAELLSEPDAGWAPRQILADSSQPLAAITEIQDRLLRERAYATVREVRDDWAQIFQSGLAKEADTRIVESLASELQGEDPERYERFLDDILAYPHRMPGALTWLAEKAADEEDLRERNALRLMQQILSSLSRDEFAPYRLRLLALVESGGTVPRLLSHLSDEQAAKAEAALERAPGLEGYQRKDLIAALEVRFPTLRQDAVLPLYALRESIDAKRSELKNLLEAEIPANRDAIEEARAMGDLRENFEYKSARDRHEYLNARAAELNGQLERARPLEADTIDTAEVRIGTRVQLEDADGSQELTILGPWESDPDSGVISYESEQAKALLGKKEGDEVTLSGRDLKVRSIGVFETA